MAHSVESLVWTSRSEICDDLTELLDHTDGAQRTRIWEVLAILADGTDAPVFEARLREQLAAGTFDALALRALDDIGATVDASLAAELARLAPVDLLASIARISATGFDPAWLDRLVNDQLRELLYSELESFARPRWKPDLSREDDRRALTVHDPSDARLLFALPWEQWTPLTRTLLWEHARKLLPILREFPDNEARARAELAVPPAYLVAEMGVAAALAEIESRLDALRQLGAQRATQMEKLRNAHEHGRALYGTVRARIKGGHRVSIGACSAFLPLSAAPNVRVGDPIYVVVTKIGRSVVLGRDDSGSEPRPLPGTDRSKEWIHDTIRFAAEWNARRFLLPLVADPTLHEALRAQLYHALRRARPAVAIGYAHRAPWSELCAPAKIDRLESDTEHLDDALDDPMRGVRSAAERAVLRGGLESFRERIHALASAGHIGALETLVSRGSPEERRAALESLAGMDDPNAVRVLLEHADAPALRERCEATMRDGPERTGRRIAGTLARIGDADAMTRVLRVSLDPTCPCFAHCLLPQWI